MARADGDLAASEIGRRILLLGGANLTGAAGLYAAMRPASAGSSPWPAPAPKGNELAFKLIRHDSPIGNHTVKFDPQGDTLTIRIDVEVLVKLGPIPLVRYTHHSVEVWQNQRLAQISANTDRNGTRLAMSAQRTEEGLVVVGSGTQRYVAPENALPTTYWNPRLLVSPMIGTQDGMLVHPVVRDLGPDPVQVAGGSAIPATRYSLRGDLDLDLWYDQTRTWAGMEFSVADGSVIHYERL
jgi:Family of unknown function (DUF6134)